MEKTRNVDALIITAINTCWREPIDLPTLLTLIREQRNPGPWLGQVLQLFSDIPVEAIARFADLHGLDRKTLERYYELVARSLGDQNPKLEAWLHGGMGAAI